MAFYLRFETNSEGKYEITTTSIIKKQQIKISDIINRMKEKTNENDEKIIKSIGSLVCNDFISINFDINLPNLDTLKIFLDKKNYNEKVKIFFNKTKKLNKLILNSAIIDFENSILDNIKINSLEVENKDTILIDDLISILNFNEKYKIPESKYNIKNLIIDKDTTLDFKNIKFLNDSFFKIENYVIKDKDIILKINNSPFRPLKLNIKDCIFKKLIIKNGKNINLDFNNVSVDLIDIENCQGLYFKNEPTSDNKIKNIKINNIDSFISLKQILDKNIDNTIEELELNNIKELDYFYFEDTEVQNNIKNNIKIKSNNIASINIFLNDLNQYLETKNRINEILKNVKNIVFSISLTKNQEKYYNNIDLNIDLINFMLNILKSNFSQDFSFKIMEIENDRTNFINKNTIKLLKNLKILKKFENVTFTNFFLDSKYILVTKKDFNNVNFEETLDKIFNFINFIRFFEEK